MLLAQITTQTGQVIRSGKGIGFAVIGAVVREPGVAVPVALAQQHINVTELAHAGSFYLTGPGRIIRLPELFLQPRR